MESTTAQDIVDKYLAIDRELLSVLNEIEHNEGDTARRTKHKSAIASVIAYLYKALDVVLAEHPNLRPPGLNP